MQKNHVSQRAFRLPDAFYLCRAHRECAKHKGDFRLFLAVKNGEGYKKIYTEFLVDGSTELKKWNTIPLF